MDYRLRYEEKTDTFSLLLNGEEVSPKNIERIYERSIKAYKELQAGKLWSGPPILLMEESEPSTDVLHLNFFTKINGKTIYISKANTDLLEDPKQPSYAYANKTAEGMVKDGEELRLSRTRKLVGIGKQIFVIDCEGKDSDTTTILIINGEAVPIHIVIELTNKIAEFKKELKEGTTNEETYHTGSIKLGKYITPNGYKIVSELNEQTISQTVKTIIKGDESE